MTRPVIAFIGGGNMAGSLIGGLIEDGYPAGSLIVADPSDEAREALTSRFGIRGTAANEEAINGAGVVVLAVKPQIMATLANDIVPALKQAAAPLIISVAAGIRIASLENWLGSQHAIVRTMPNTPAMVQAGATALFANTQTGETQRSTAESIMRTLGLAIWLEDEAQMDAVTALSGSGPAYFFLIMEALEEAAVSAGLPADTARLLTLQTAFGAAKMAIESEADSKELRRRVTSPGGTTERAIQTLEEGGLRDLLSQAVLAAQYRSRELAAALGSPATDNDTRQGETANG